MRRHLLGACLVALLVGATAYPAGRMPPRLGGGPELVVRDGVVFLIRRGVPVYSLAFSPDGKMLAAGCGDATVRLWDLEEREAAAVLRGHRLSVYAVAFSPDGATVASGSADHTVRLWDAADGSQTAVAEHHRGPVRSVVFSPSGGTLAAAGGVFTLVGEVKLLDAAGLDLRDDVAGHRQVVSAVAFSSDGRTLASGGGRLLGPGEAMLWNLEDRKPQTEPADVYEEPSGGTALENLGGQVLDVAFSPDGDTLALAGADMRIRLVNTGDGDLRARWKGHTKEITFVGYMPDGSALVSAAVDNTLRLWDPATGDHLGSLYDPYGERGTGELLAVAISPDGRTIATGRNDGRIKLWNVEHLVGGRATPLYEPSHLRVYPVGPMLPGPPVTGGGTRF